jgi:EAL domain-containing protein (putative c-di-GMP-specific phosphodiesterase class I)
MMDVGTDFGPVTTAELRRAVDRDELFLHVQPMVDLASGQVAGAEALLRWEHPLRGLVAPFGAFRDLVRRSGLMAELGRWVVREAIRLRSQWPRGVFVSVDVTSSQLTGSDGAHLVEDLAATCHRYDVPPADVWMEITESERLDATAARGSLDELQELGVRGALGDFGAGSASVALLRDLPVRVCKIDRSFVEGLSNGGAETVVVRSILDMTHAYGMTVVAEGVENAAQLHQLTRLGCDLAQGHHLHRPMPADELPKLLEAPAAPAPLAFGPTTRHRPVDHRVTFFERDARLVDEIVAFLAPALESGGTALVIADLSRAERTQRALKDAGIDVAGAGRLGRLLFLDPARTVEDITVGGTPDRRRMEQLLGARVVDAGAHGHEARIYTEMGSLLHEHGDPAGALGLEALCDSLSRELGATMLCAYPLSSFARDLDGGDFRAVCDRHTTVLPTERLRAHAGSEQLWRSAAGLEQQAVAATRARQTATRLREAMEVQLEAEKSEQRRVREELTRLGYDLRHAATGAGVATELLGRLSPQQHEDATRRATDTAVAAVDRIEAAAERLLELSRDAGARAP